MRRHAEFLVALADRLDQEGNHELADVIDKDFEEFLDLLESGELDINQPFSGGQRDPRQPYSGRGTEMFTFGVPGPQ